MAIAIALVSLASVIVSCTGVPAVDPETGEPLVDPVTGEPVVRTVGDDERVGAIGEAVAPFVPPPWSFLIPVIAAGATFIRKKQDSDDGQLPVGVRVVGRRTAATGMATAAYLGVSAVNGEAPDPTVLGALGTLGAVTLGAKVNGRRTAASGVAP